MAVGEGYNNSYRAWSQSRQSDQNQAQWPQTPRAKSPRSKGKGKGKNKGKHKSPRRQKTPHGDQVPPPPPQSASTELAVPAVKANMDWLKAAKAIPATAPVSIADSSVPAIPQEFRALIDTLKKNQSKGTLPEDVQNEMKTLQVKEEKDNNKELNQALKGLRKARKEVQDSLEARSTLHAQWRKFLSMSVTQWQGFTNQFQAQETAALQRITEAQQALQEAKAMLAKSKEIAELSPNLNAEPAVTDVDLVSDSESTHVEDNALKMQHGLLNLTKTLEQLHTAAEDIHESEQAAKKARLVGPAEEAGFGSGALEPFHKPGTKRPQSAGVEGTQP